MKTIAIMNLKGGVGKTTTTITLADMLSQFGEGVLVIDADPQGNATAFYGYGSEDVNDLSGILSGLCDCSEDFVLPTRFPRVYLVPGGMELAQCDIAAIKGQGNVKTLADFIETAAEDYGLDYVLIDCPPGFTAASVSALYAADEVIIPTTPDINAISGMAAINQQISAVRENIRDIKTRVLITAKRPTKEDNAVADELWESSLPVCETPIRWSAKVQGAMNERKTLLEYSPNCIASRCYVQLLAELANDGWKVGCGK